VRRLFFPTMFSCIRINSNHADRSFYYISLHLDNNIFTCFTFFPLCRASVRDREGSTARKREVRTAISWRAWTGKTRGTQYRAAVGAPICTPMSATHHMSHSYIHSLTLSPPPISISLSPPSFPRASLSECLTRSRAQL
jgi:hypothetical protein